MARPTLGLALVLVQTVVLALLVRRLARFSRVAVRMAGGALAWHSARDKVTAHPQLPRWAELELARSGAAPDQQLWGWSASLPGVPAHAPVAAGLRDDAVVFVFRRWWRTRSVTVPLMQVTRCRVHWGVLSDEIDVVRRRAVLPGGVVDGQHHRLGLSKASRRSLVGLVVALQELGVAPEHSGRLGLGLPPGVAGVPEAALWAEARRLIHPPRPARRAAGT